MSIAEAALEFFVKKLCIVAIVTVLELLDNVSIY